ncbi:hypothetical protein COOONC_24138, partial [Cooperia oncophora]
MTSPVKKSKKKCDVEEAQADYERSFPSLEAGNRMMVEAQTASTNGIVLKGDELTAQASPTQNRCSPEDRQRINVGWFAGPADAKEEYDHKIAVYSQRLGCQMYNFISYPIGGVKRGFWKPNSTSAIPPPIDLPDVQLQNHLWETYINAQISSWIDCDSENEELAALSEIELQKELNYCAYMGLRSAVFRLKHADSPRLARILNQWLWTRNVNLRYAWKRIVQVVALTVVT